MTMTHEEIKKLILEKYPSVELKNELFFENYLEFSLETIALKLSKLSYESANKLLTKLKLSRNIPYMNEMLKYIIEENSDYFNIVEGIIEEKEVIKEYTRIYLSKYHTVEEFKNINISSNIDQDYNFSSFDINYYNKLILMQHFIKTKEIKQGDISDFLKFTKELLKANLMEDIENYDINYDKYVGEILNHIILVNITPADLYSGIFCFNKMNRLLLISKFKTEIKELENNSVELISSIKGKQINSMYLEFMALEGYKQIKKSYTKENLLRVFINMSILLGYDNVTNIIRHLPKEEEKVIRLFEAFKDINLSKVKVENNNVVYNREFINFVIGNNLNEPKSVLNLIYNGKTSLSDKIEKIYSYWDILDSRYKNQPLKTRLAFLEECLSVENIILNPDEYRLEGQIINSYYDNKKHQSLEELPLIEVLRKEYSKIKHNYQKTIPYIKGTIEEYSYEILLANDPTLFSLGAASDNCFKIGGDASDFVKYCANNKNGRALVIKNKEGLIMATAPMFRNGNLVICNSLETIFDKDKDIMKKLIQIIKDVSNKIIDISSKSEQEQKIEAVVIGGYKHKEYLKDFPKLDGNKIDRYILETLGEKIYTNIGGTHPNYIISSSQNFTPESLKSFEPTTIYNDPRKETLEVEREFITNNVINLINSIYFEAQVKEENTKTDIKKLDFENVEQVIFNDDWFIFIDRKYNITSKIVGEDPRAFEEYQEYLNLIKEYASHYDKNGHVKDESKYSYGRK